MAALSNDQLLQRTKSAIREASVDECKKHIENGTNPLVLDVREADEVSTGQLKGAVHIPRGALELKIEGLETNRDRDIVAYCAGGVRSARAVRSLNEMGYSNVTSMAGGFTAWKNRGYPWHIQPPLSQEQKTRYSRHIML